MFKRITIYTALLALFITMWGCDKLIYDQPDDGGGAKVYLSVDTRAVQANDPESSGSINYQSDFEDAVHDLAMIIFESGKDDIHSSYFNSNVGSGIPAAHAFSVELIAESKYDFYFVANMADLETKVGASIKTRNDVMTYLNDLGNLNEKLYEGASAKGQGLSFPMARVYLNQVVPTGGSVYQPKPFYPKQHANDNLVPNVIVNVDGNGEEVRDYVELVRVVAKLEVNIQNTLELEAVERIYYKNAFRQFSLTPNLQDTPKYKEGETIDMFSKEEGKYWFYMPEALMSNANWGTGDHKPINYFVIKMKDGTNHEIPIITAKDYKFEESYLAFAKSSDIPEKYNIIRNHKYVYTVKNLTKNIEVNYEVNPWNKVTKTLYMGYGYNVEIDSEGNVKITNTIDDCMPHRVELIATSPAKFILDDNSEVDKVVYGYSSKTDDGFTEAQMKTGYSEEFNLTGVPETGNYLEVWYNGTKVKTFSK